jgi:hypothetical protein
LTNNLLAIDRKREREREREKKERERGKDYTNDRFSRKVVRSGFSLVLVWFVMSKQISYIQLSK